MMHSHILYHTHQCTHHIKSHTSVHIKISYAKLHLINNSSIMYLISSLTFILIQCKSHNSFLFTIKYFTMSINKILSCCVNNYQFYIIKSELITSHVFGNRRRLRFVVRFRTRIQHAVASKLLSGSAWEIWQKFSDFQRTPINLVF